MELWQKLYTDVRAGKLKRGDIHGGFMHENLMIYKAAENEYKNGRISMDVLNALVYLADTIMYLTLNEHKISRAWDLMKALRVFAYQIGIPSVIAAVNRYDVYFDLLDRFWERYYDEKYLQES